jgi:phytoene dehydrogenase-like protein
MGTYDAIVIGSGLGGLTAAAVWGRHGKRVLVLERQPGFGGAARVYTHGGLTIEASLHEIDGLDPGDAKVDLLRELGVWDALRILDAGAMYEVRSRLLGEPFMLPHGMDQARQAALWRFGRSQRGVHRFFDTLREVHAAFRAVDRPHQLGWWLRHGVEVGAHFLPVVRNSHHSVASFLDEAFGADEAAKLALAANLGYLDSDPARLWFLVFAMVQASYLTGGGHYLRGGSQSLTDALLRVVRDAGGETLAQRTAEAILLDDDGRVHGVQHRGQDGSVEVAHAPVVFGNAAPHVLADMLPAEAGARLRDSHAGRELSISLFVVSLGMNRRLSDIGVRTYSTFLYPDWITSLREVPACAPLLGAAPGARMPVLALVDYGAVDTGLNAAPPYLCSLTGVDQLDNWVGLDPDAYRTRREQWMDALIAAVDREFPGFAAAVVQREMSTALTMQRELNTPGGAVYGFAATVPPHGIPRLPSPRTPVDGLWLASAFVYGGGYSGAMMSGAVAARMALKAADVRASATSAGYAMPPP